MTAGALGGEALLKTVTAERDRLKADNERLQIENAKMLALNNERCAEVERLWSENKGLRRELEYRKHGIDPAHPNPDGSDYHIMNAIDEKLERK
jgi:hypothetical protein